MFPLSLSRRFRQTLCLAGALSLPLVATARADVLLTGGEHVIDYAVDDSVKAMGAGGFALVTVLPDGLIAGDIWASEDSRVEIRGGQVGGSATAYMDGTLVIFGGRVEGNLEASADIGDVVIRGGTFGGEFISDGGEFHIYGSDFALDGSPIDSDDLSEPFEGILSGILEDGSTFANRSVMYPLPGVGFNLIIIPEPSSGVLGILSIPLLTWFTLRRGRKSLRGRFTPTSL